jgi:putative membrane protein
MNNDTLCRQPIPKQLHPLSMLFEMSKIVRQNLIPTIAALFSARNGGSIGLYVGVGIFVIGFLVALVRYFTFRYQLSSDELIIHRGLFGRLHRTIPIDSIQNIDLSQNIFHRLLGVAEVRIDTASGNEAEAVMRVLSMAEFRRLKDEVLAQKKEASSASKPNDESERSVASAALTSTPSPTLILALPPRLIVLAGFLSNRGEVLAGIALGFLWQMRFGENWIPWPNIETNAKAASRESIRASTRAIAEDGATIRGALSQVHQNFGILGSLVVLVAGLFLLIAVLRTLSAIWFLLKFYGYRLERHGDSLHVRCGLLTQISATIPLGRVQLVSVQRSWLARRCGIASIRIETAGGGGSGKSEDAASSVGRKWFVPVLKYQDVPRILSEIDSRIELDEQNIRWNPLSKDAAKRMLRPVVLLAVILSVAGLFLLPYWGWCFGFLVGFIGWLIVAKKSKSRRYARTDWGVIYRSGTLLQKCSMTFFEKVQSASLNVSPFDRNWKMASLGFDTASAGPANHRVLIEYLDADFAKHEFETLQHEIRAASVLTVVDTRRRLAKSNS